MQEYILKKNYSVFVFSNVTTKSYPEIKEDWNANAPKMAINVGDKFELENFRLTVANKSEPVICLQYFFPIDKHCFSYRFFTWQSKNMKKLNSNCAQLFRHNNYKVSTMGGTVRSSLVPHPTFYDQRSINLQPCICLQIHTVHLVIQYFFWDLFNTLHVHV